MKKIIVLPFLVIGINSIAQSTLIEFNYHDESYQFYKITKRGDTIKKKQPFSYRNVPVKVVVKDLNTYYYDVTFDADSYDEVPVGSEQNVETLLSGYATGLSAFNDLVGEVKQNDIYQSVFKDGKFQGLSGIMGAFGMAGAEYQEEMELLEENADQLKRLNDEFVSSSIRLDELFDYMTLVEFTNRELQKLLYDPTLTHAEMKKRAEMLTREVFSGNVEMSNVIALSTEKAKVATTYQNVFNNYMANSESLLSSSSDLSAKLKAESMKQELGSFNKIISERMITIVKNHQDVQPVLSEVSLPEIRGKLMSVYDNYEKIINADFNYEYSLLTDRDVTQVTMRFGISGADSLGTIKTRIINVPTHGGLRINTSAGMSFVSFLGGQNSYVNDGGYVQEIKGDLFRPAITTMFHCYRQSYRPFTVGGSFGLSVPIEGTKDFMYMAGLSGIIGKKQRVIINVGGLGGKVEKLSDGYTNGSALVSTYSEVPVKSVFDFGVFVGVTFNINSLGLGSGSGSSSSNSSSSSNATTNNATTTTNSHTYPSPRPQVQQGMQNAVKNSGNSGQ